MIPSRRIVCLVDLQTTSNYSGGPVGVLMIRANHPGMRRPSRKRGGGPAGFNTTFNTRSICEMSNTTKLSDLEANDRLEKVACHALGSILRGVYGSPNPAARTDTPADRARAAIQHARALVAELEQSASD